MFCSGDEGHLQGEERTHRNQRSIVTIKYAVIFTYSSLLLCCVFILVMNAENLQESKKHSYYKVCCDIYLQFTIIMLFFHPGDECREPTGIKEA